MIRQSCLSDDAKKLHVKAKPTSLGCDKPYAFISTKSKEEVAEYVSKNVPENFELETFYIDGIIPKMESGKHDSQRLLQQYTQ